MIGKRPSANKKIGSVSKKTSKQVDDEIEDDLEDEIPVARKPVPKVSKVVEDAPPDDDEDRTEDDEDFEEDPPFPAAVAMSAARAARLEQTAALVAELVRHAADCDMHRAPSGRAFRCAAA